MSKIERAKSSPTFCIYPFSHFSTKTDGALKLCCRSEPIGNIKKQSVSKLWNGEDYQRIRRQLLNGQRPPECDACWRMEDVGARSMRQRALREDFQSRWMTFSKLLDGCDDNGVMATLPRSVELKISNLCNLRCRMCSPVDSTSWAKEWPAVTDLMKIHDRWSYETAEQLNLAEKPILSTFEDSQAWWSEFDLLVENLEVVEFAGGEPLMDPVHYRILELLERRAPHIQLKYSSNLTRINFRGRAVTDYWKNFASVELYASIDGIFEVYDYIRTGAKFSEVDKNLDTVKACDTVNYDDFAIACTIQVYNAFHLPQMAEYFLKKKIKFHTHRVTFPAFLNVQVLPAFVKEQLSEDVHQWMKLRPTNEFEEKHLPRTHRHLVDHINFMNGEDESHLLPAFVDFTRRMDRIRGTDASRLAPALAQIMRAYEFQIPEIRL